MGYWHLRRVLRTFWGNRFIKRINSTDLSSYIKSSLVKHQVHWHLGLATSRTQWTTTNNAPAKINFWIGFYSSHSERSTLVRLISSFSSCKLVLVDSCILLSLIKLERCFKHDRYSTFTAEELDMEPFDANYKAWNPNLLLSSKLNTQ